MDKIYIQYAELLAETSNLELELSRKKRNLEEVRLELNKEVDEDGSYGLDLSAHAFTNLSDRLVCLADSNSVIFNDLMNITDTSKSILWPNNMRAFIIGIIAIAKSKNKLTQKPSKNTEGGTEYHYEIEIEKWGTSKEALVFTAVVESNVIKTGYFNWKRRI